MRKIILLGILFATGFVTVFAQEREEYSFIGWELYNMGTSNMQARLVGDGVIISGTASTDGAGYVIESRNLGLDGMQRIILVVSGIDNNTDTFDAGKLFKLELNGKPARAQRNSDMNRLDPAFLNARNGEYTFDLQPYLQPYGNILKINIVFYNCTVRNLTLHMFIE